MTNGWVPSAGMNRSARFRLFCFPHAGGGASAFGNWSRRLPASVEVVALHLPGREERHRTPPLSQLEPLLHSLVEALRPYLDLPFAFYGHSLGAWLAFYLARRLRRDALPQPLHLFIAAARAPQLESRYPGIHTLSPNLFLDELRQRYDNIPAAIWNDPDLLALIVPPLQADFQLMESIQYPDEAPLACPISAWGGLDDAIISQAEISAWGMQTRASFFAEMMAGGHFFVKSHAPAFLDRLSSAVRPYLDWATLTEHALRL
jgi:medium-chain acyl-[acyl-carrier-protein] hydrolase